MGFGKFVAFPPFVYVQSDRTWTQRDFDPLKSGRLYDAICKASCVCQLITFTLNYVRFSII